MLLFIQNDSQSTATRLPKNLSCLTASFDLNLELNNNVYVIFLDKSNAYDTVCRNGLLFKLYNIGITSKALSLIQNYHSNTVSSVVVNQTRSRWFFVYRGIRQGGMLSTFLYLIFINDLFNKWLTTQQFKFWCSWRKEQLSFASRWPIAHSHFANAASEIIGCYHNSASGV